MVSRRYTSCDHLSLSLSCFLRAYALVNKLVTAEFDDICFSPLFLI